MDEAIKGLSFDDIETDPYVQQTSTDKLSIYRTTCSKNGGVPHPQNENACLFKKVESVDELTPMCKKLAAAVELPFCLPGIDCFLDEVKKQEEKMKVDPKFVRNLGCFLMADAVIYVHGDMNM